MSDRPVRERPVRERKEPTDDTPVESASGRVGIYEQASSTDSRRTDTSADQAPESIGVYNRPAEADRGIPPLVIALLVIVVLAVLALLAITLLF